MSTLTHMHSPVNPGQGHSTQANSLIVPSSSRTSRKDLLRLTYSFIRTVGIGRKGQRTAAGDAIARVAATSAIMAESFILPMA